MTVESIELPRLLIAFVPVILVIVVMWYWGLDYVKASYAMVRMLLQLLLVGYALVYIFAAQSSLMVLVVLMIMVAVSSWIALNTIEADRALFGLSLLSIGLGGSITLILIVLGVLQLQPWYEPRYLIPLAGMTFANAMTSVSLSAERFYAEMSTQDNYAVARTTAFNAGMIPVINSLFAVGLVSLPGMMTGQILSGVSPFVAARYQIMVMCMIFASAGLSTLIFLYGLKFSPKLKKGDQV